MNEIKYKRNSKRWTRPKKICGENEIVAKENNKKEREKKGRKLRK